MYYAVNISVAVLCSSPHSSPIFYKEGLTIPGEIKGQFPRIIYRQRIIEVHEKRFLLLNCDCNKISDMQFYPMEFHTLSCSQESLLDQTVYFTVQNGLLLNHILKHISLYYDLCFTILVSGILPHICRCSK